MKRSKGSQRVYPPSERDLEKRQVRERDEERLRTGAVSPQDLMREDPFAGFDLSAFRITHIGRRPVMRRRKTDDEQR